MSNAYEYDPPTLPHVVLTGGAVSAGCGGLTKSPRGVPYTCTSHCTSALTGRIWHVAEVGGNGGDVVAIWTDGKPGMLQTWLTACGRCGNPVPCGTHPPTFWGHAAGVLGAPPVQPSPPVQPTPPVVPPPTTPAVVWTAPADDGRVCAVCGRSPWPCAEHPPMKTSGPDHSQYMDEFDLLDDA